MYADYNYYKETYKGTLPEPDFTRLSQKASAYVDNITFNRINDVVMLGDTGNRVKNACCAVTDALLLNEQGGGLVSETVGKHTRNYAAGISNTPTEGQRLYTAVSRYLATTGLMYRGC